MLMFVLDAKTHLRFVEKLTVLMDSKFKFFGYSFGLDPIIGLIPGVGDTITSIISLYILWIGRRLDLPQEALYKMARNVILDFILGMIPILGDLADFYFHANTKNLKIIQSYLPDYVLEGELIT